MIPSKDNVDLDKRMEAARILREDAKAIESALIQELSEQYAKLVKQIEDLDHKRQELDSQRQDIGFKLSCLRGEVDESVEDFRSKRHHVKDEVIVAFLIENGSGTTGEVQEYFQFAPSTVCRRMDALLAAGKVTMERQGTTKIWKAAA